MIMSKGIHAVSPRITPVVLSKAFFKSRSEILSIHGQRLAIYQQRQHAVRESPVILKSELLRLNEFLLFNHAEAVMNGTAISSEQTGVVVFRQTFIQKHRNCLCEYSAYGTRAVLKCCARISRRIPTGRASFRHEARSMNEKFFFPKRVQTFVAALTNKNYTSQKGKT